MTTFDPRLLPPDEEEKEQPLYRSVWRSAFIELGLLGLGTALWYVLAGDATLAADERSTVSLVISLVPVGLWWLFSWRAEQRVQHPRQGLFQLLIVSMLVANAITAPLIEQLLTPGQWLNDKSGLTRIFGFMVTTGIAVEFSKYLVLRYRVWPGHFRQRVDGVAYSLAASLGFATVFNIRFALLEGGAQPAMAAIHITSVVLMQQAAGLAVAYGLSRLKFDPVRIYELAAFVVVAALTQGFYLAVRAGMVVRGFGIGATANSPLLGLIFSVVFAGIMYSAWSFLIAAADERDARVVGPGTGPVQLDQ